MDYKKVVFIAEKLMNSIIKFPLPEIVFVGNEIISNKKISGMFIPKEYKIVLNRNWIENSHWLEIIILCIHEFRHAYQYSAVLNNYNIDNNLLNKWKNNFKLYEGPKMNDDEDFKYLNQDIEIDAISFTYLVIKKEFDTLVYIPEEIYSKVIDHSKKLISQLNYFN